MRLSANVTWLPGPRPMVVLSPTSMMYISPEEKRRKRAFFRMRRDLSGTFRGSTMKRTDPVSMMSPALTGRSTVASPFTVRRPVGSRVRRNGPSSRITISKWWGVIPFSGRQSVLSGWFDDE